MDWSKCSDVERAPGKVSGAWVVKGTRVPVQAVVDDAKDGYTPEEIAGEIFEGLPLDRVRSVIRFARIHGQNPPTEVQPGTATRNDRTRLTWENAREKLPLR
jgi:uncharacterized protein (DUF433 family)